MDRMIYAIVSVKNDPDKVNTLLVNMKGISGATLYSISFNEISVIVSDIKRAGLISDRTNAIEYADVIETLSQNCILLPVRFGSVMESTDAILKMIERNYHEIQQNLQKVENKVEFGLKIFCDSEKLKAELNIKTETDTKSFKPLTEIKSSIYTDWVNKKLKEHRLEEILMAYIDKVIAVITENLIRLNAITKFKKMPTATTIIDGVFLLDKKQKNILIHEVGNLQNQYPELNFVLTGPWPPYNFVDFTVK